MSTVAAAAQTADRIDYWIRRHVIQYCYGTHPLSKPHQVNSARDRRIGLLAIGQCLKDQYDAETLEVAFFAATGRAFEEEHDEDAERGVFA